MPHLMHRLMHPHILTKWAPRLAQQNYPTQCQLYMVHSPCISRDGRDWHFETAPLSVSYARQDFIVLAVILAVTLYIRQPLFLMHSVHEDLLAMSWKTGCPFVLTLHTRGLSSALCEGR